MKISFLTPYYKPRVGGVERHVAELTKQLLARGHSVTILTYQHDQRLPLYQQDGQLSILRRPHATTSKPATWAWVWKHRSLLRSADRIHAHDVFWWLGPLYPFIFKKVYTTFHGWEGQYPVRWQAKLHRLIASILSKKTIHIGGWIRTFYLDTPDVTMYGGATPRSKNVTALQSADQPHFVFLGRLEKENDIQQYLAFVQSLKHLTPALRVTWVGDGAFAAQCAQLGTVTGMTTRIEQYLKSATLAGASSYLAIWDALSFGLPVVALYSQPLKEQYLKSFPESHVLFMGKHPDKIAQQVADSLSCTNYFNSLKQQCVSAAQLHSWENVAVQYLDLWNIPND